jgi:signal transduction histidine kinase
MKLLSKTNFYFFGVALVIYCVGGVFFYLLFETILDRDNYDKLEVRKEYILKQLAKSDSVLLFQKYSGNLLSIKSLPKAGPSGDVFSDTIIYDQVEEADRPFRQLTYNANVNGKSYQIQLRRPILEDINLIEGDIILVLLLFAAFVLALSLLNRKLSIILWSPFYTILEKINSYKIEKAESIASLKFPPTKIDEFELLSAGIEKLIQRIHKEFKIQKEFIENASHEIQTPLAIIANKLELLLGSPGLTREQMDLVNSSMRAVNRLSKLNESLLIISKIENSQFNMGDELSLNVVIDRILENLDEVTKIKSLKIVRRFKNYILVKMNPLLAEILLENLITNSVKHNIDGGTIRIISEKTILTIENTGTKPVGDPSKVFNRFVKLNTKSNSIGLGLSIVKSICETYGYDIDYTFEAEDNLHKVQIDFKNALPLAVKSEQILSNS